MRERETERQRERERGREREREIERERERERVQENGASESRQVWGCSINILSRGLVSVQLCSHTCAGEPTH